MVRYIYKHTTKKPPDRAAFWHHTTVIIKAKKAMVLPWLLQILN